MNDKLSRTERHLKNIEVKFYEVTDRKVAEKLIEMNKYMYFVDEIAHWKTGNMVKTWCFEYLPEIKNDAKKIRDELYKKSGVL